MNRLKLGLFALLLIFSTITYSREINIKVIVTSDIHATVFPYDFVNNVPLGYGLANVHFLMETIRMQHSNKVILLDNGDLIQGQPTAYYAHNISDHKHNLFSRVLNFMNYDAATIGNHDIEAGPDVYERIRKEMKMPWLGANVINTETGKPHFKPYTIVSRSGINIAIIGLVTDAVPTWLPQKLWEGLEFKDLTETATYWVNYITENESPDAIIGLFHSGLGDYADEKPEKNPFGNAAGHIARFVPGFDVIFTGHDHVERNMNIVNIKGDTVLIVGAGSHGKKVAVAHLDFKRESRRVYNLKNTKGEVFEISPVYPSPTYMTRFDSEISEIFEYSNQLIGAIDTNLNLQDAFFGNSAVVDFIHKVQLEKSEADISFAAPLGRNFSIRKGDIRMRDLYKIYPFENYLYIMELTGKEIKNHLEYSYGLWFRQISSKEDLLLHYYLDDEGNPDISLAGTNMILSRPYNFESAAGIKYVVDISKEAGNRINILSFENGDSFELDKTYRVAINSYRGSGGGNHLLKGAAIKREDLADRIVYISDSTLRNIISEYIEEQGTIKPLAGNNWSVEPAELFEYRKEKELKILFP